MSEPAAKSIPELFNAIQRDMAQQGIDLLLAFHDGAHFIEKPNAVMVLSGFKSLGHALVILPRDSEATLVITPSWDIERAADASNQKYLRHRRRQQCIGKLSHAAPN